MYNIVYSGPVHFSKEMLDVHEILIQAQPKSFP
jgi:hypothetical protein